MPETTPEEILLRDIIASMVDFPDQIEITRATDDMGVLLSLKVAKEDMGRVIGKAGTNVEAIRTVLRAAGRKANARLTLKVLD